MIKDKYRRLFKTRNFGLIIGFIFALLFCMIGSVSGFFAGIEAKLLDTYFSLSTKNDDRKIADQKGAWYTASDENISDDILILGIDLKTLQRFGMWPFSRSVHVDLINTISRIKDPSEREKVLFLDIFFIDNSVTDPEVDQLLAETIAESGTVFLESILDFYSFGEVIDEEMFARQSILFENIGLVSNIKGDWKKILPYYGLQTNLPEINAGASGYGAANMSSAYIDNVVRKQPLVLKYSVLLGEAPVEMLEPGYPVDESLFQRLAWFDKKNVEHQIELPLTEKSLEKLQKQMYKSAPPLYYYLDDGITEQETRVVGVFEDFFVPSITFSMALKYWGATYDDCEVVPGKQITVNRPSGDPIIIPVDDQCAIFINFAGPASSLAADGVKTFPVRSYSGYVRDTSDDPETWPETGGLKNKLVMVGAFDKGMADDEKQTPFGMMYGIEIHANSLNTMLTGNYIRYIPSWLNTLAIFVLIMLIAFIASRIGNFWSLPVSLVLAVVLFFGCSELFDRTSYLFNYTIPFVGMVFTYVAIILYRSSTEEREKRKIRAMFGKYVSPDVVSQMIDHPPELGGIDRELTVFFSDIRGFTSLSETLTPQELVKHLNVYLSAMTDIILETGGTLDKYVGDEIMCFWGAPLEVPDHAARACRCALMQKVKLAELNAAWPPEKQLAIGIGLNTGIMTVGNMGSEGRMNYTLMGDNVNLGARLEGTNKVYGTMIIVSEYTYAMVKDQFVFRELDTIRVKGKNKPVVIYELAGEL
ncbi:adenylate/guanylate cyclase domain-containing protein [Brucepastera parasyntrophica]|uniref:adenylate/guanylate cyclase domain-containing protein n=1 Tax=Brucepastera parasyntrophica TaxID=2880008 RepID=UPI00210BCD4A|nr:adenylate/guanylate cyclase domain-containing protein [Brucepastera parasyntrophica]ULQ59903.1 adenylate/guanylate cyclase domain-containing protein [Brucepastera parasyntrophica]